MLNTLLAHDAEVHFENTASWVSELLHQPTWVSLILVAGLMTLIYFVMKALRVKPPARLLTCIACLIGLGILYLAHNAAVTGIVLSVGFVAIFLFVFAVLSAKSE